MNIPALRAQIGDWTYYVTTLTFQQVHDYVSKVDEELHTSSTLKELIQRSITNNYISIKNYILNQNELFFNSLVLAVYDDYPDWREIELRYNDAEVYQVGILEFPGAHKIFPLDGQHRVEGIKAALIENPELRTQQISAIFIGHKNDAMGMRRSRRLFSTLNRYAKPVTMDDIIALDEDDSIAIATRELLENFDLFSSNRVTKNKNKAIPDNDKTSFTSIITLYECNRDLLKLFRQQRKRTDPNPGRDSTKFEDYLKFRPSEDEVELFNSFCFTFWSLIRNSFPAIQTYLHAQTEQPAFHFRNSQNGGNLLFRPIGLLPIIQAAIEIHKRTQFSFEEIFTRMNEMNFEISQTPWNQVVWNPYERIMIMANREFIKLLTIFLFNRQLLNPAEENNLQLKYASAISYQGSVTDVLNTIN